MADAADVETPLKSEEPTAEPLAPAPEPVPPRQETQTNGEPNAIDVIFAVIHVIVLAIHAYLCIVYYYNEVDKKKQDFSWRVTFNLAALVSAAHLVLGVVVKCVRGHFELALFFLASSLIVQIVFIVVLTVLMMLSGRIALFPFLYENFALPAIHFLEGQSTNVTLP